MELIIASLLSFFIYLITDKFILKKINKAKFNRGKFPELRKVTWITIFSYLRLVSKLAMFTYLGLWLLFATLYGLSSLSSYSESTTATVMSLFVSIDKSFTFLRGEKTLIVLSVLSLVIVLYGIYKVRKVVKVIRSELQSNQNNGTLENKEYSEDMKKVNTVLQTAISEQMELTKIPLGNLSERNKQELALRLKALNEFIPNVKAALQNLDVRRRILEELENKNPSKSRKSKFFTFFISQGMVSSISKVNGFIGRLGIVLLLLSFLSASSSVVINSSKRFERNLMSASLDSKSQSQEELWEELKNQGNNQNKEEFTKEDEELLEKIAREYEIRYLRSIVPNTTKLSFQSYASIVKQQIIGSYAIKADGTLKQGFEIQKIQTGLALDNAQSKNIAKFFDDADKYFFSDKPVTDIGKNFKNKLQTSVLESPKLLSQLRQNSKVFLASFQETAKFQDILGLLLNETMNGVFQSKGNHYILTDNLSNGITKSMSKNLLDRYSDYRFKQFRNDLLTEDINTALNNISELETTPDKYTKYAFSQTDLPLDGKLISSIQENSKPGLIYNDLNEAQLKQANTAMDNFASSVGKDAQVYKESLANFESYFPAKNSKFISEFNEALAMNVASEVITNGAANSFSGGGGGSSSSNNNRRTTSPRSGSSNRIGSRSFIRARSYGSLKGFRRIGGVLIGKEPESVEEDISFVDIFWENKQNNQLEIILKREDGEKISAGIFDKDIINQALAYVADGRLVTATMVKAEPIPFFKIFLHPTLVNTNLGCQAIGVDRFVDKYTTDKSLYEKETKRFRYQEMLYKYVFFKIIESQIGGNSKGMIEFSSMIDDNIKSYEVSLSVDWDNIYYLLDKGTLLRNKNLSHMAANEEKYNAKVIEVLKTSLNECNGSFKGFNEKIDVRIKKITEFGERDIQDFFSNGVEPWSGVREHSYTVDKDLNFLKKSTNNALYPLSFIRQIVFVSATEDEDSEVTDEEEQEPWEFPELKDKNEEWVLEGILSNQKDYEVVERMKSFIFAQRLFRVILNGHLGTDFPLEKLILLAEETKTSVQTVATPTWNAGGSKDEFLNYLSENPQAREAMEWFIDIMGIYDLKNTEPCN